MATVFNTDMTAHVWAQGRQAEGRTPGGRVFFDGPRLFSYGRHFLIGFRLPDGAAFLNSDSYSISTSRHQRLARSAVRGRSYYLPGALLEEVTRILESLVLAVDVWTWPDGFESDSPYGHATFSRSEAKRVTREGNARELGLARARLESAFLKAKETIPRESILAALHMAGATRKDMIRFADKVEKAHAARARKEEEDKAAAKKAGHASDAKAAAARPLSDFAGAVAEARAYIKAHNYSGAAERHAGALLENARRLFLARKEAKARGWTRIAADLKARESVLREGAKGMESYSTQCARLSRWAEQKKEIRAGLSLLALPGGPSGMVKMGGYEWQKKRQTAESVLQSIRAAALYAPGDESTARAAVLARAARLMGASLPDMAAGLESIVEAFQGAEARANAKQARANRRAAVATLRAWKAAGPAASAKVAEEAARVAGAWALSPAFPLPMSGVLLPERRPAIPGPFALAGFTAESFMAIRDAAKARAAEAKAEEAGAALEEWRAGRGALPSGLRHAGGRALLRAVRVERDDSGAIVAGVLETSQGASVPLTHALRAFRFLKLCRDAGKEWRANGKTLPVGHFRIDMIDAAGNFRAGCHSIAWQEVAALAARLGVADLAPADTTEARAHA